MEAQHLLEKKLNGVLKSSEGVNRKFRWRKQILHIFCQTHEIAKLLKRVYRINLNSNLKKNTIILCTVVKNSPFVFFEKKF